MRCKDLGIWRQWTWAEMAREIRDYSLGLEAAGLKRGERIAIVGGNRPRLYWTLSAAQALGAIPVPVYSDSVAGEMAWVLEHAGVRFAACQDQEQVDKVLSCAEKIPGLELILYDEPRGVEDYEQANVRSIEAIQETGREALASDPGAEAKWRERIEKDDGTGASVILYTSGTTGRPKGVTLSSRALLYASRASIAFDRLDEKDVILSYLPPAWVGDHIFTYAQGYAAGYCACCPESPHTVDENRREIAPTYFFAPPRVFEAMLTSVLVRMQDAGRVKRALFDWFMAHARKVGEPLLDGKPVGIIDRLLYRIGELAAYGPLKNRLGFTSMRVGYTAGEAIGPEIFRFYRSLGLNLKQLYGQTEASVFIAMQPDGEISADTVGPPFPGVEVKIDESGEVCYRSPAAFLEYYRNEGATKKTRDSEGWVRTGDAGFLDSRGHLRIVDRAKDVGKLSSGGLFAPKYIENKLKFFPDVKEAVAFGDGRDFCAVMLNIDLVSVGNWAERNNVAYASYQELAQHPEVYAMMENHVAEVNRGLAAEEGMSDSRIARFLVLHKELDADDGELTRTQKVRRGFIAERYAPLVEALYDGSSEKRIETEVVFEDGRKGKISATVAIRDMKDSAGVEPSASASAPAGVDSSGAAGSDSLGVDPASSAPGGASDSTPPSSPRRGEAAQ